MGPPSINEGTNRTGDDRGHAADSERGSNGGAIEEPGDSAESDHKRDGVSEFEHLRALVTESDSAQVRGQAYKEIPLLTSVALDQRVALLENQSYADPDATCRDLAFDGVAGLRPDRAVEILLESLGKDSTPELRNWAAYRLTQSDLDQVTAVTDDQLRTLYTSLFAQLEEDVTGSICHFLAKRSTFGNKFKVLQGELLDTPGLVRDNVQWNAISMSLGELSPQAVGEASRDLITKAIGAREDQRALALYAGLLVAISRGSTRRAAELVTEVVHAQSIKEPEVRDLRIEIGGRTALKPVLEMLESDFSKPMRRLRHTTMKDWEDASNAAKRAFLIRTLMSVAVFVLGLFVVALSSYQYLFAGNESWGPGISLAAGLAAVLSVVYSGPLSDVRKSVESLTTTSIGFITFMHRLQFVSGLVASDYAHGKLDYPGLDHAERLLQRAAAQATHQIAPSKNSNSRKPRAAREPSASPQTRTQESAASQVELADSLTIDGELGDDTHRGNPDR